MTELLDLFNKIRRLDIITPQGQAGVLAKESHFVFNYHQSAAADLAVSLVLPIRQQSYYTPSQRAFMLTILKSDSNIAPETTCTCSF